MQFIIALITICPKLYDIDLVIFLIECVYQYYKIIKKNKEGHEVTYLFLFDSYSHFVINTTLSIKNAYICSYITVLVLNPRGFTANNYTLLKNTRKTYPNKKQQEVQGHIANLSKLS